jgi:hypothetical protein
MTSCQCLHPSIDAPLPRHVMFCHTYLMLFLSGMASKRSSSQGSRPLYWSRLDPRHPSLPSGDLREKSLGSHAVDSVGKVRPGRSSLSRAPGMKALRPADSNPFVLPTTCPLTSHAVVNHLSNTCVMPHGVPPIPKLRRIMLLIGIRVRRTRDRQEVPYPADLCGEQSRV